MPNWKHGQKNIYVLVQYSPIIQLFKDYTFPIDLILYLIYFINNLYFYPKDIITKSHSFCTSFSHQNVHESLYKK